MTRPPAVLAYGLSLAAVAAAVAARLLLEPVLNDRLPFITLFLAVAFAAWYGGRGPAVMALLVGAVAVGYFVLEPRYTFAVQHLEYRVGLVLYCIIGIAAIAMFESLRNAHLRLEEEQRSLEAEIESRRAAERILAEREAFLRVTLGSIGDGVLTTDADGKVSLVNAVASRLTGWTQEEAAGKPLETVFTIVNEDTRRPVENPAKRALIEGVIVGLANHTLLISRDGTERAIDDSAAPIRDDQGHIIGAVLVFRDVTEQRSALREQERALTTLEKLVSSAPVGITIFDEEMRYMHLNQPLAEMNGLPVEGHIGRTVTEIVPDILPQVEPIFRRVLETGESLSNQIIEGETAKAPGVKRVWRESWFPIPGPADKPIGVGAIVEEITEQRRAEARLRKKNERLRLFSDAATTLLLADDPNAMLPSLFDRLAPHFGLDVYFHFIVNEAGDSLALASCAGIPEATAHGLGRLEFGQAICGVAALKREPIVASHIQESGDTDAELVRSFGVRVYACSPLMAGERLLGTLSFGSRTRDEFEPDEVEFLLTIGRYVTIAYERIRLIQQLSDADRNKDEFLATLAHELRNPLAPITNSLETMKRASGNAETIDRARSTMERQVRQMVRLVDDLLDVSRITRNKLQLRMEHVDLATIVNHAVEACRPECDRAGHHLEVTLPSETIHLHTDPTRLTQVLVNLLANSCKFTRRGGRIALAVTRHGSEVEISVQDSGVGISPEMLPRVFDLFTQVDRSLDSSQGGLGIGLSLVKRLVEMHGGTVSARSEGAGRGSEFVVRLPISASDPAPPVSEPAGEPLTMARRILVVDDNTDSADSLAILLEPISKETLSAYDGVDAIEKAASFRPEVILLDIGLPKLDGYSVCRAIRQEPWGKDIVMIALTGWGHEEGRRKSKEAGFDGHLVKPVEYAALTRLLGSLLRSQERSLTNR